MIAIVEVPLWNEVITARNSHVHYIDVGLLVCWLAVFNLLYFLASDFLPIKIGEIFRSKSYSKLQNILFSMKIENCPDL